MKDPNIKFMEKAIWQAKRAFMEGEVPVGAVIVKDGKVIARGRNRRETSRNALSHAEIEAIGKACKKLGGWRLFGCDLYVTLEPCPMCAGAVINSRIDRVFFGAYDPKGGACGSVVSLFDKDFNHRPACTGGLLEEECAALLKGFFSSLRAGKGKD